MAPWLQGLIALVALAALAPLLAWLGRRVGAKAKGGVMLASAMLGLGEVFDPPAKRPSEATSPAKGSPDNGEPPPPET